MSRLARWICLASSILVVAGTSSPRTDDAAILSAVLLIWYRDSLPDQVVLQSESNDPALFTHPAGCPPVGPRAPMECTDWARDSLPPALLEAAKAADFSDRTAWKTTEVPPGTVVFLPADRDAIFAPGAGGWTEFHRRFPRAHGFEELSRPVVSSDGQQAVIRAAHRCGPLCGEGGVAWLGRSPDGQWRVVRWFRHWIS